MISLGLAALMNLWIRRRRRRIAKARIRRYNIRPAHCEPLTLTICMEIFDRYYRSADQEDLRSFCRFTPTRFDELLLLVEPQLTHPLTHLRPIFPRHRLAIFLRHIAHGISYEALQHEFAIGVTTVKLICEEVAAEIVNHLLEVYLPVPTTDTWISNAEEYLQCYGFPHVIGAIDGKHFMRDRPNRTGEEFWSFKGYPSQVMLALCNAKGGFLAVDIGSAGRTSDSALFSDSPIKHFLESAEAGIPEAEALEVVGPTPYIVLADGGFGLREYMMTPFTQPSLNSRARLSYNTILSAARHTVESAFGQLVQRFSIFRKPLQVSTEQVRRLILSTVLLHNMLGPVREEIDEDVQLAVRGMALQGGTRHLTRAGTEVREKFVRYFSSI
uniref:DDE Tnp4 domain-containing protein n=1 Tax=Ditylenchus dipsaci TaxID=166011 RepID=A0A915E3N4_9BILA